MGSVQHVSGTAKVKRTGAAQDNNIIPAVIKGIQTSKGVVYDVLFSVTDVLQNGGLISVKEDIKKSFQDLVGTIKTLLGAKGPSYAPKKHIWDTGNLILTTKEDIKKRYSVEITNMIEAVAANLGLSKRFVQYMAEFSEIVPREKVTEDISWSTYMSAIDLIDKRDFEECISLIKKGTLKTREDVRRYVREKNKQRAKR